MLTTQEAEALDADGLLRRAVLTPDGWYVPKHRDGLPEPGPIDPEPALSTMTPRERYIASVPVLDPAPPTEQPRKRGRPRKI